MRSSFPHLVSAFALASLPRGQSAPACALTGSYFYSASPSEVITFAPQPGGSYSLSCAPNCGWSAGNASIDAARPWSAALLLSFDNGVVASGWALAPCSPQRVIYFSGAVYGAAWCAVGNDACAVPVDPLWAAPDAAVHLAEVSHSDIFWLGAQDDVLVDAANINASLALMAANSAFVWQHECILFLRVYVEMYPGAEPALLARIAEGRFDIGGTFTEGFESTMVNEMLARQMYTGRKWFVERYPGLDSAVVAFHQDGPLRAAQMPQVYAKAGMRYLKPSRLAEDIVVWRGLDGGAGLLAFPQWQCETQKIYCGRKTLARARATRPLPTPPLAAAHLAPRRRPPRPSPPRPQTAKAPSNGRRRRKTFSTAWRCLRRSLRRRGCRRSCS